MNVKDHGSKLNQKVLTAVWQAEMIDAQHRALFYWGQIYNFWAGLCTIGLPASPKSSLPPTHKP